MVVVGGGPAGAAAAITLARAGRSVVVVDKATFPRDKFCGDGLTTGALRLLESFGLRPSTVTSWHDVGDVVIRSPSGRSVTFALPAGGGTYAAVARRVDLDAAVLDLARDAGAMVHEGAPVTGVQVRADRVVISVGGRELVQARYAIGADGMWSPTRKLLGASTDGYRGEWHAFRQYFSGVGSQASKGLHVWFDADLLPGYAWSFPLAGGSANVGFGIMRGGRSRYRVGDMARLWPEVLGRAHIRDVLGPRATAESPHRAWPIPARIDDVSLSAAGGRVLFVGDAAAAADLMTGEGIGQALSTGSWAARAIDGAGPYEPATAARLYTDLVRRELVPDHRTSALLGRALARRSGADAALRTAGTSSWTRQNFARWLFEDYPRAVLVTPRHWRRGALSGPGAFATERH